MHRWRRCGGACDSDADPRDGVRALRTDWYAADRSSLAQDRQVRGSTRGQVANHARVQFASSTTTTRPRAHDALGASLSTRQWPASRSVFAYGLSHHTLPLRLVPGAPPWFAFAAF